jgi:hypothetical protein
MKLGHHCDVCDVAIWAGSNMDEHDAGQIHKALKDVLSHMTVNEFLQFWEGLKCRNKRRIVLKHELRELQATKTDTAPSEIQQVQPNVDTIPDDILQVLPNIERAKVSLW